MLFTTRKKVLCSSDFKITMRETALLVTDRLVVKENSFFFYSSCSGHLNNRQKFLGLPNSNLDFHCQYPCHTHTHLSLVCSNFHIIKIFIEIETQCWCIILQLINKSYELHVFNFFHLPNGQTKLALATIAFSLPRPATNDDKVFVLLAAVSSHWRWLARGSGEGSGHSNC